MLVPLDKAQGSSGISASAKDKQNVTPKNHDKQRRDQNGRFVSTLDRDYKEVVHAEFEDDAGVSAKRMKMENFEVGDRVKVACNQSGGWYEGEVMLVTDSGWVEVKLSSSGERTFCPQKYITKIISPSHQKNDTSKNNGAHQSSPKLVGKAVTKMKKMVRKIRAEMLAFEDSLPWASVQASQWKKRRIPWRKAVEYTEHYSDLAQHMLELQEILVINQEPAYRSTMQEWQRVIGGCVDGSSGYMLLEQLWQEMRIDVNTWLNGGGVGQQSPPNFDYMAAAALAYQALEYQAIQCGKPSFQLPIEAMVGYSPQGLQMLRRKVEREKQMLQEFKELAQLSTDPNKKYITLEHYDLAAAAAAGQLGMDFLNCPDIDSEIDCSQMTDLNDSDTESTVSLDNKTSVPPQNQNDTSTQNKNLTTDNKHDDDIVNENYTQNVNPLLSLETPQNKQAQIDLSDNKMECQSAYNENQQVENCDQQDDTSDVLHDDVDNWGSIERAGRLGDVSKQQEQNQQLQKSPIQHYQEIVTDSLLEYKHTSFGQVEQNIAEFDAIKKPDNLGKKVLGRETKQVLFPHPEKTIFVDNLQTNTGQVLNQHQSKEDMVRQQMQGQGQILPLYQGQGQGQNLQELSSSSQESGGQQMHQPPSQQKIKSVQEVHGVVVKQFNNSQEEGMGQSPGLEILDDNNNRNNIVNNNNNNDDQIENDFEQQQSEQKNNTNLENLGGQPSSHIIHSSSSNQLQEQRQKCDNDEILCGVHEGVNQSNQSLPCITPKVEDEQNVSVVITPQQTSQSQVLEQVENEESTFISQETLSSENKGMTLSDKQFLEVLQGGNKKVQSTDENLGKSAGLLQTNQAQENGQCNNLGEQVQIQTDIEQQFQQINKQEEN